MPDASHTPQRTVRIPESLWQAVQQAAAAEERTVSDVIRWKAQP